MHRRTAAPSSCCTVRSPCVRPNTTARLGLGTQVASVTMTVFYVLLYFIWRQLFPAVGVPAAVPALIFATAALRIALCLMPQNDWRSGQENLRWELYRNIPFAVTGVLVIALFAISGNAGGLGMWRMCVAIALSFAFKARSRGGRAHAAQDRHVHVDDRHGPAAAGPSVGPP